MIINDIQEIADIEAVRKILVSTEHNELEGVPVAVRNSVQECSSRSVRQSPAGWAWSCRSSAPLSKRMVGDCGRKNTNEAAHSFSLRFPSVDPVYGPCRRGGSVTRLFWCIAIVVMRQCYGTSRGQLCHGKGQIGDRERAACHRSTAIGAFVSVQCSRRSPGPLGRWPTRLMSSMAPFPRRQPKCRAGRAVRRRAPDALHPR